MSSNTLELAGITFDFIELGAALFILVIVLAFAAMTANAIMRARQRKKTDQKVHDQVEKAFHPEVSGTDESPAKGSVNQFREERKGGG